MRELASAMEKGATLIDVRTKAEFGICHLDGSVSEFCVQMLLDDT